MTSPQPDPDGEPRRDGLATEFGSADESPGLMLWRATNRWQAAQRAALRPHGLTHVQFVLLASLSWLDTDRPVTQKHLADHAETDVMMTSQVLRTLEVRGLVRRAPHPDDGRARALTATDEGRELANRAVAAAEECDRVFFSTLGSDRSALVGLLRRLAPPAPR